MNVHLCLHLQMSALRLDCLEAVRGSHLLGFTEIGCKAEVHHFNIITDQWNQTVDGGLRPEFLIVLYEDTLELFIRKNTLNSLQGQLSPTTSSSKSWHGKWDLDSNSILHSAAPCPPETSNKLTSNVWIIGRYYLLCPIVGLFILQHCER